MTAADLAAALASALPREMQWQADKVAAHQAARLAGQGWLLVRADLLTELDQLRRGGEELGKTLLFWLELAREVTNSDDVIDDDGDGDWELVAERLAALAAAPAERTTDDATQVSQGIYHAKNEISDRWYPR